MILRLVAPKLMSPRILSPVRNLSDSSEGLHLLNFSTFPFSLFLSNHITYFMQSQSSFPGWRCSACARDMGCFSYWLSSGAAKNFGQRGWRYMLQVCGEGPIDYWYWVWEVYHSPKRLSASDCDMCIVTPKSLLLSFLWVVCWEDLCTNAAWPSLTMYSGKWNVDIQHTCVTQMHLCAFFPCGLLDSIWKFCRSSTSSLRNMLKSLRVVWFYFCVCTAWIGNWLSSPAELISLPPHVHFLKSIFLNQWEKLAGQGKSIEAIGCIGWGTLKHAIQTVS